MKHVFKFTPSLHQILIAFVLCVGGFSIQAQDLLSDEVSLAPGYTDMVFYSFLEGQTGTAEQSANMLLICYQVLTDHICHFIEVLLNVT